MRPRVGRTPSEKLGLNQEYSNSTRRRRRRSSPLTPAGKYADLLVPSFVVTLLVGSACAIGTVHVEILLTVSAIAFAGLLLALSRGQWFFIPATWIALCLSGYTLLQIIPLPISLLRHIAPTNADIWERAVLPFGDSPLGYGRISIDPGASALEALKWFTYAVVFSLAAFAGHKRGRNFVVHAVFASASSIAAITMVHGALDAEQVFGFYEPTFAARRWSISPLLNANNLAGYVNLGVFTGIGLFVSNEKLQARIWYAVSVALCVAQCVLSGSRGGVGSLLLGILAACVTLLYLAKRGRRPRRLAWSNFVLLGPLSAGILLAAFGAYHEVWSTLRNDSLEKLGIMEWSLPLLRSHPFFGVGAGAFETAFPEYRPWGGHIIWAHPENFVLAWIADWGFPVGLSVLLAFAWLFRPSTLAATSSRVAACSFIGVLTLTVQNVADLGFSTPAIMIALATLLGGLWGAQHPEVFRKRAERATSDVASVRGQPSASTWYAGLPVAIGALTLALALVSGRHTARRDREELSELSKSTDFRSQGPRDAFLARLRTAIERHPGDAYLPRLGAAAAIVGGDGSALRWITRSLEREPINGRTHILAARFLARRGALKQALLELRLAAESDSAVANEVATRALSWTSTPEELYRAIPDENAAVSPWAGTTDAPRAKVLRAFALRLKAPEQRDLRARFLKEAASLEPDSLEIRVALTQDLIRDIERRLPPCDLDSSECRKQAEMHIAKIGQLAPYDGREVLLQAQLLTAIGEPIKAVAYLDEHCLRTHARCLRSMVELSAMHDLGMERPARTYLAVVCHEPTACAEAHTWIASLYAKRKLWVSALAHYTSAAELYGTAESWVRVAEAAQHLGAREQTMHAIDRARRFTPDHKALDRIEKLRRALLSDTSSR